MSVKIISGDRRGAILQTPDGFETRPLRERIRQALFNMLRSEVRAARVIDVFAGSGAVGLEALSNGATHATLIDASSPAIGVIRKNVEKLRYEKEATILQGFAPEVFGRTKLFGEASSIAFLMPPYHTDLCTKVMADSGFLRVMATDAVAVCEIEKSDKVEVPDDVWELTRERDYGVTRLLFYRRKG